MVHSSLGKVGYSVGGPVVVVRALLEVLTPQGTLVMPAESPSMSNPGEHLPVFDPRTTPTTMGAIPEAFRTYPGTRRSNHPLVSVCANGPHAETITAEPRPLAVLVARVRVHVPARVALRILPAFQPPPVVTG
jgi:aminoglycoside 3-N-acetyltransferase